MSRLLSPVEAAEVLGIKVNTFAKMVRQGRVKVSCTDDGQIGFMEPNLHRIEKENRDEKDPIEHVDGFALPFYSQADKDRDARMEELEKQNREMNEKLTALMTIIGGNK